MQLMGKAACCPFSASTRKPKDNNPFFPPQFRSATQVQLRIRVSRFTIRISKWVVFAFLLLHWNSCVQFLVAAATEFPEGCWVELTGKSCVNGRLHIISTWVHGLVVYAANQTQSPSAIRLIVGWCHQV